MSADSLNAGFIGLGAMGLPMAACLARAGLLGAVWNRTPEKAEQLKSQFPTLTVAATAAELTRQVDVVLICVSADDDLATVIQQISPAMRRGQVVIDTSTVAPSSARQVASQLAQAGVGFIDAPVSGGVEGAKQGSLSVMAGGEAETLQRVMPLLECFAKAVHHMGPAGNGQATKAVNQVIVAGVAEAVCEALALGEALELPQAQLLSVLNGGAAGGWFLQHRGQSMLDDQFSVGFKQTLLLKDLGICQRVAQECRAHLPVVELAADDYRALVEAGEGDHDISGLIRLKRRNFDENN